MSPQRARQHGFTLIELLIVILIIAILAAIATGAYARQRDQSKKVACRADMSTIEKAEKSYIIVHGDASADMQTLAAEHFLDRIPACPGGGTYSWQSDVDGDVVLTCSIHGTVSGEATVAAASPFTLKTDSLIKLLLDYRSKNGRWPRSWAPYCYTDLGLDPAEYAGAMDNVFYTVGGAKVNARPAPGYVMTVTDAAGKTRVLTNKLKWNLTYDATTGTWYYHTIDPANVIDISTLKITPQ